MPQILSELEKALNFKLNILQFKSIRPSHSYLLYTSWSWSSSYTKSINGNGGFMI